MKQVSWPTYAKIQDFVLHVRPHSRGKGSETGFGVFEKGPGARWIGSFNVAAMCADDALKFRAFIHSLRGVSGSFAYGLNAAAPGELTLTIYTDGTQYTDSMYDDLASLDTTAAASITAGATSLTVADASLAAVGGYAYIGPSGAGQLVRIVGISGNALTVRPALRQAYANGSAVAFKDVFGYFRFTDIPRVSIVAGGRSQPLTIQFEEDY